MPREKQPTKVPTKSADNPSPRNLQKASQDVLQKTKGRKTQVTSTTKDSLSEEDVLTLIETKMSSVFAEQYEELKDKLITLMAQQVSKLIAKVNDIEQEFLKYKEEHQDQCNNAITIVENTTELEAIKNSQAKKSAALSKNIDSISNQLNEFRGEIDSTQQKLKENNVRLVGLPESQPFDGDELKSNVIQFSGDHLGLHSISEDDIEEVTRLGKVHEDKPRDVLITFRSKQTRNKITDEEEIYMMRAP